MWIKKEEYEAMKNELISLRKERDTWKDKYTMIAEDKMIFDDDIITMTVSHLENMFIETGRAEEELNKLRPELETWKQKYADEVQKRLALIEQMKG